MKMKTGLNVAVVASVLLALVSCSQPREWNEVQRAEFISSLGDYRQMIYLDDLNDVEFVIFSDGVATDAEVSYPVYTQLMAMPALSDSVDLWVVTSIVEELNADAANIRHIYPYHKLVEQGILPEGLDHEARMSFYNCLAQKVNAQFSSLEGFFYAVVTNALEPNIISTMQSECAASLILPDVE
ncbi:MAG: hypothetical protein SNH73_04070 [Rikenellaceae bacterium]